MFSSKQKENHTLVFRRFRHKGFALFSCLGREVRIGVLRASTLRSSASLLAVTAMTLPGQASRFASAEAADTLDLGEAVVAASRAPLASEVQARPVVTLTRRELAAAGVTSVNDALKLAAGIDVRQRGAFGIQTDISINGGTFDQISLLVNGIAVNNPQTGHNSADFPLNIADIERIEVLEGAASRLFGSQAFSGAVNIVTKKSAQGASGAKPGVELQAHGGSYGTVGGQGRLQWGGDGGWQTSVSGGWERSDGAVDNGDFSHGRFFWQGSYDHPDFSLEAQAGASLSEFGANTFYSAAYPDQWEATRRLLVSVKGESKGRVHFVPQVSWLRNVDHYQLVRNTKTGENFNLGDVYTASLSAWTRWLLGTTSLGAEIREENLYSTNLGREMDESLHFGVKGEDGINYTKKDGRTNVSYFAEHNVVAGIVTVSAGVLAQRNSSVGRGFSFYPGVDLSLRPGAGWRLFASWNKSLRLPTFTDLWYKSPSQEGNTNLRPEKNSSFHIGAELTRSALRLSVKGFYNRGTDMIDWVMFSADDKYHTANFQLDNYGAGATLTLDFDRWLGQRQPLSWFKLDYAYIYQHRRDDQAYFKSNYALEYLRHKLVAVLAHRIVGPLAAEWTFRLQDREGSYLEYSGTKPTGQLRPYGTHALLDCKLTWEKPNYSLFVDMTNLTSHRYYDLGNVRQPGFLVMAGGKLKF